jgi:hypothetical protein
VTLRDFLIAGAARPFAWGVCDCSLWPADWLVESRGVDPVPDLRGTYSCWIGAIRRVRRAGGLAWIFGPRLEAIGMRATLAPAPGDLGVVKVGPHLVGAVRTPSGRWAVKRESGVIIAPFETVLAWTF